MDESYLFPGFGRSEPINPVSNNLANLPEPAAALVAKKQRVTVDVVDHAHLVPPTFEHFGESLPMRESLSKLVEQCLRNRRRFPHMLLCGPADTSKRSIATTIAREMAVPITHLDMLQVSGPDELHSAFRSLTDGSIVLLTGIDLVPDASYPALSRCIETRERVHEVTLESLIRKIDKESWKKSPRAASHRYADFTIIATARRSMTERLPYLRWVELQCYTRRNAQTEQARLRRGFLHAGVNIEETTLTTLAEFVVTFKLRTLQAINRVLQFLRESPVNAESETKLAERLPELFFEAIDPKVLKRILRKTRATTAAAAAPLATGP